MQAFGVPRLDAGAEGIHLVWTWPDVLPVSQGGYDIQRLGSKDQRWQRRCQTIDPAIVGYLLARGEYPAFLGPLRLRPGASFGPITDSDLLSPNAGTAHSLERPADSLRVDIDGALAAMVAKSASQNPLFWTLAAALGICSHISKRMAGKYPAIADG